MSITAGYVSGRFPVQSVPQELRDIPRWLLWRRSNSPDGRVTKLPYQVGRPSRYAACNDPAGWSDFSIARYVARLTGSGIGFVFTGDDDLIGIDLDKVIVNGEISPLALEIVYRLWSYTELSPSGTGLHIIMHGVLPYDGRRQGPIEAYATNRYLSVTGAHLPWTPTALLHNQAGIDWLVEHHLPAPVHAEHTTDAGALVELDDLTLLDIARSAANGDTFSRLFDDGDLTDFDGDHSRADASLMSRLAFYTKRNPEQMERLFSVSALGQREKWTERPDYRRRTVERACDSTQHTYSGDHSGRNWFEGL